MANEDYAIKQEQVARFAKTMVRDRMELIMCDYFGLVDYSGVFGYFCGDKKRLKYGYVTWKL